MGDQPLPKSYDELADENARLRATVEAQENQISAKDKRIAELEQEISDLNAIIPVDSPGREGQTIIPGPIGGGEAVSIMGPSGGCATGANIMPTGVDEEKRTSE